MMIGITICWIFAKQLDLLEYTLHMVILNRDCTEEADVSDPYFVFLVSGLVVCNIGSYFAKNGLHY